MSSKDRVMMSAEGSGGGPIFAIRGALVHCVRIPESGRAVPVSVGKEEVPDLSLVPQLEMIPEGIVGVYEHSGRIAFVRNLGAAGDADLGSDLDADLRCRRSSLEEIAAEFPSFDARFAVRRLPPGALLLPGFIDTHNHAPQHLNAGLGMDLPLLGWLDKYTFPGEARYADDAFARRLYTQAVKRSLSFGTTTCVYFGTIYKNSTKVLVDVVRAQRQRAFVGKVCMDRNAPDFYVEESCAASLADTEEFVQSVIDLDDDKVTPVVTPRFVPTCSSELMRGLGDVAARRRIPIQSHISENQGEIAWVRELHPECESYTDVYLQHGLLNDRAIMGHAIYLSDKEVETFRETGAAVSHCPISNFNLHSGVLDVQRLLRAGVKVSLGTDVSGGHTASMLEVMRQAVTASNTLHMPGGQQQPQEAGPIDFRTAFALATLGGARAVGMEDELGNFVVGKQFDALVVDPTAAGCPFDVQEQDTVDDIFSKFIYLGNANCITDVYVQGKTTRHREETLEEEVGESPRSRRSDSSSAWFPACMWGSIGVSVLAALLLRVRDRS